MASTARRQSLIGAKIGNYSIVSTLGEGGMGIVFLAEHPVIGKRVAIKVLHEAGGAAHDDAAARAFLEARAVNEIRHPNVVDVLDCGVADLGERGEVRYLVMEYLDGQSLRETLRGGPLGVERAVTITIEVGRALAAAHAKGIVHRDIKPENIFVVDDGVKVLDFGIAKLLDGNVFGERLTRSGVAIGTPQYMAPEQLDGEPIDGRADVYALAIVLYEMLAGSAPFAHEKTARGVWRRMNEVPTLPDEVASTLPAGLGDVVIRALDPDRERRPQMDEFVAALEDPATAPKHETRPLTVRLPKQPPKRESIDETDDGVVPSGGSRKLAFVIAGAAIAVVIAVIAIRALTSATPSQPAPNSAKPTPAPAKPAPDIVTVAIASTPAGAEVYVGDERAPRGVTPLSLALPRDPKAIEIRLVRAGYSDTRRSIGALRDDTIEVTLVEQPRKGPPPTTRVVTRKQPPPPVPPAGSATPPPVTPPPVTQPTGDGLLQPRSKSP